MRTWMVAGATTLMLVVGSQAAEARAGRGFGRLFSGRTHTTYRPAVPNPSRETRIEPRAGMPGSGSALVVTPGRVASAAAAGAVVPAWSAETSPTGERVAQPARSELPGLHPMQEARVLRPPCAPERTVGRVGSDGTGFCLIN